MKTFKAPRKALSGVDPDKIAALVTAAADIALLLDRRGIVRDVACGSDELAELVGEAWVGKNFLDIVTGDSRPKVQLLLDEIDSTKSRSRQVNHPDDRGGTFPVLYQLCALAEGRAIALGRDLRPIAALQQRLVEVEQSLERDYSRLRLAETRYRLLLQSVGEVIVIVDPATQKVLELNAAAQRLFGEASRRAVGRPLGELIATDSTRAIADWLGSLRSAGRADELRVRVGGAAVGYRLVGALFRQDNVSQALLRLVPLEASAASSAGGGVLSGHLSEVIARLPDALVVTDLNGRIESANRAFLDLAQLATPEQVRGESLERWLGRPGVDFAVLLGNLREHGTVRLFASQLRGEYGSAADVEISAVLLGEGAEPCLGFALRNIDRRRAGESGRGRELPRSVDQLTELVGRVSLKELVRETTDVIERLCIEAALDLTRDNRASAAEMLGLSRQSLYVKLRRYGLGDLTEGSTEH